MWKIRPIVLSLALTLLSPVAFAAELNCGGASNVEEFRYTWRLRSGLRWIAAVIIPTSGIGNLRTVYPKNGDGSAITSELLITPPRGGQQSGFFAYESDMDRAGRKTLMTYNGYQWGEKSRKERTVFDYVKRLARIHKETPESVENKVKPIEDEDARDTLTAIYYLRQNASKITGPVTTSIYEGRVYDVIFRPIKGQTQQFVIDGKAVRAVGFEIVDAPGGRKWKGHVKVWLSEDERRIPFRIEMAQSMASLQLDLQSIESCAFMQASK